MPQPEVQERSRSGQSNCQQVVPRAPKGGQREAQQKLKRSPNCAHTNLRDEYRWAKRGPRGVQQCSNNRPQVVPKVPKQWPRERTNRGQTWVKNGPHVVQKAPRKWSKRGPAEVSAISNICPKFNQKWSTSGPKGAQVIKEGPKRGPTDFQYISKGST